MINPFRTLIVEDDQVFRQTIRRILERSFPSVTFEEAGDGVEAMEKIGTSLPDLVFMDIKLPGENGLQLTKRIKGLYPNITVIILTSHDLPEYREAAYERGANHFVCKHLSTTEEIIAIFESVLFSLKPAAGV